MWSYIIIIRWSPTGSNGQLITIQNIMKANWQLQCTNCWWEVVSTNTWNTNLVTLSNISFTCHTTHVNACVNPTADLPITFRARHLTQHVQGIQDLVGPCWGNCSQSQRPQESQHITWGVSFFPSFLPSLLPSLTCRCVSCKQLELTWPMQGKSSKTCKNGASHTTCARNTISGLLGDELHTQSEQLNWHS